MIDEIQDRTYQAGREQLHDGLDRAFDRLRHGVATTFQALHGINFSAPWKKRSNDVGCA